jgi:hypothetical protein
MARGQERDGEALQEDVLADDRALDLVEHLLHRVPSDASNHLRRRLERARSPHPVVGGSVHRLLSSVLTSAAAPPPAPIAVPIGTAS